MAADYPVTLDIEQPQKFQRPHVVIRLLLLIILSFVGSIVGWLFGLVYLILPVVSAIFISQKGGERFLAEDGPRITGWLRWLLALYAYLGLATDRFPTEKPENILRFEMTPAGKPTVGSALLRLIYSIPSAFVIGLLGIVGVILWIVASVFVFIQETYPSWIFNFTRGILRWDARLFSYHSSLVDRYPPFALDTEAEKAPV